MKYIMLETDQGEKPIIFPDSIEHAVIADATDWIGKTRSAGFVKFISRQPLTMPEVQCWGFSRSLNLHPHEDDEKIIEICLRR